MIMDMPSAIRAVMARENLSREAMQDVMRLIMTGAATPAQIGGFLVGLRMKGESVDEIVGAASVMRELVTPVIVDKRHLVDTCGTGGDGSTTFNISTSAAFVVAAAGGRVAKHGNRAVSSRSGSADVLEAAGVSLNLTPEQVARAITTVGVGFLFAPLHHGAMQYAIGPRREMGVRTIFNLLGPLTNPAGAPNQVMGVYAREWVLPLAEVLRELGSEHVLVVHSADGMDEFSISADTYVAELKEGVIREYSVSPADFDLPLADKSALSVSSVAESLAMMKRALRADGGAVSDVVALNAGAAIYASGIAGSLANGVAMARDAQASGLAREKLDELVGFTEVFKPGIA